MTLAILVGLALAPGATNAASVGDWSGPIRWRPLDAGLQEARKAGKPVCVVVYTTWCSHCRNYSRVFRDPDVVAMAERFVMVLIDQDKNPRSSLRYAFDGRYIPRTIFLRSDGTHRADITAGRTDFKYFFDEQDPESLLGAMKRMLQAEAR